MTTFFRLSSLPTYYVPRDGPLSSYKVRRTLMRMQLGHFFLQEYVNQLPGMDHPEAFGQHPNADISSQIRETKALFGTLLSLRPQVTVTEGVSSEDKVLELSAEVLKNLPEEIDYEQTAKLLADDLSPLNVVLLQEVRKEVCELGPLSDLMPLIDRALQRSTRDHSQLLGRFGKGDQRLSGHVF